MLLDFEALVKVFNRIVKEFLFVWEEKYIFIILHAAEEGGSQESLNRETGTYILKFYLYISQFVYVYNLVSKIACM